jgi:hypothetical protein
VQVRDDLLPESWNVNIKHSSESNEFYTPSYLVEAAREVFGGFDVDPATTPLANERIRAKRIFTKADNGYLLPWGEPGSGLVAFVNPPGGVCDAEGREVIRASKAKGRRACTETGACGLVSGHRHYGVTSSAAAWWAKTCVELRNTRISSAFFVGFSVELIQTAQSWDCPNPLDFVCVFPSERIPFDTIVDGKRVSGEQPTHASVLVFAGVGANMLSKGRDIRRVFREIGYVHVPGGRP